MEYTYKARPYIFNFKHDVKPASFGEFYISQTPNDGHFENQNM